MSIIAVIPESHCTIVERLGKFSRVESAGLNFRIPFIERRKKFEKGEWVIDGETVAHKKRRAFSLLELSEQRLSTKSRLYHTKDNVQVDVDAVIFWRIVNPEQAVYAVDNLVNSIITIALNALRSNIGSMTLDQVLMERVSLTEKVTAELAATSSKWGVVLNKVEIQELNVNEQTQGAMLKQMEAERERRAAISLAEGHAKAKIIQAEAEQKAIIMQAEAQAKALELIAAADTLYLEKICQNGKLEGSDVAKLLIARKYVEGFTVISQNPANKVFLPSDLNGLMINGK